MHTGCFWCCFEELLLSGICTNFHSVVIQAEWWSVSEDVVEPGHADPQAYFIYFQGIGCVMLHNDHQLHCPVSSDCPIVGLNLAIVVVGFRVSFV
jgi:hypothetical protein